MPAIMFGSISTVADTSELQRSAFNDAFSVHGLDWRWDQPEYQTMLVGSGGQNRIAEYASERGQEVDAEAVHATKSRLFQQSLATAELEPRPGVVESIRAAKDADWKLALVTTTSHANIESLLGGLGGAVSPSDFDIIVDASSVDQPKPDPAAFAYALDRLGEQAADCVAIEDNVGGFQAARSAGLSCVAFPNENTAGHDFDGAAVVNSLSFDDLQGRRRGH